MRSRGAQISLTLATLLLGVLLVMQLRTQGRIAKSMAAQSTTDQSTIISNLYDANTALRAEVLKLVIELDAYDNSIGQSDLAAMEAELDKLAIVNGLTEASGPGIEMATNADLRPEDIQDLINELRNAGAEALGINDIRITARSAVTQVSGNVYVADHPVTSPYQFLAIGHPDTLEKALLRKGGLVTYLQNTYPGAFVTVAKQSNVILPADANLPSWSYATPTK